MGAARGLEAVCKANKCTRSGGIHRVRMWMSICTGGNCFSQTRIALHLAIHAVGKSGLSFHNPLAVAGDHLPPLYDPDLCAGLQSGAGLDRLGLVLGRRGPVA